MYVNLLPHSFQRDLILRQSLMTWSLIWATVAVAMLLLCGFEFATVLYQQNLLAEVDAQGEPIRQLQKQVGQTEQQLAAAKSEQDRLDDLLTDHRALAALAIVSRAVKGAEGRVQILTLQFHCPHTFPTLQTEKKPLPTNQGFIQLQGVAADDAAIAALVDALRHVPLIVEAELKSSSHLSVAGAEERKFEIVCKL